MSQNIIDVSFDIAKFDPEQQKIIDGLEAVYELSKKISETSIKPGSTGGFTELKVNTKEYNDLLLQQAQVTKQLADAKLVEEKANRLREASNRQAATAAKNEQKVIKDITDERKQLNLALKESEVRYANLYITQGKNHPLTLEAKEDVLKTRAVLDDLNNGIGRYTDNVGNYSSAFYNYALGLRGVRGPVKLLGEALGIGAQQADQLRLILEHSFQALAAFFRSKEKKAAAEAQDAAATAANTAASAENSAATEINTEAVEKNVKSKSKRQKMAVDGPRLYIQEGAAINSDTVATEANTVAKEELTVATGAATGATRLLMSVLKFAGISLIISAIGYLAYKIYEVATASKTLTAAQKLLNEEMDLMNNIYKDADKNAGKEIADLKLVYAATQDVSLSTKERTKAAKYLQDTYPDTFKNFSTEQILLGEAKQGYDDLTESIIKMALAKAAQNQIEELEGQRLDAENERRKVLNATNNELLKNQEEANKRRLSISQQGGIGQSNNAEKIRETERLAITERRNKVLHEQDQILDDIASKEKFLIDFVGAGNLVDSIIGDGKKKKGETVLQSTKDTLDLEFELYKIYQSRKLKLLDDEQNNSKRTFEDRMAYARDFYDASVQLAEKTAIHEINVDKDKLDRLEANYEKAKGTEKNNLAVDIENEKKQIIIATAKRNDELLQLQIAFNKKQDDIAKDEVARQQKIYEDAKKSVNNVAANQKGAIEANAAVELGVLDKLLHDKIISQEEYDKRKEKSIKDNLILQLNSDLQEEKSLRDLAKLRGEDVTAYDNKITELTGKLLSAQNQTSKADNKPEDRFKTIVELSKDATDAIQSLVDIGYQKEIDAIQKIIDLNNYRKDQEVKNINDSTLSAQEKAAQLIILDNTVAANNHKLLVQQNQEKVKQAKFDRDLAILKIIEDVAGANFKLIAEGGFAGIAAGIAVGLKATAAIAEILAKPLPTVPAYAHGTDNHPGGDAIVGEGQFKEIVEPFGGKPFIADHPVLLKNLARGSKVKPITADILNREMYNSMLVSTAQHLAGEKDNGMEEIRDAIYETGRMTAQALRKQKGANVIVILDAGFGNHILKSVKE